MINLEFPINKTAPLNRGLSAWYLPIRYGGRIFHDLNKKYNGEITSTFNTQWIGARGLPSGFYGLDFLNNTSTGIDVLGGGALLTGASLFTINAWFYYRTSGLSGGGRIFTTGPTEEHFMLENFGAGLMFFINNSTTPVSVLIGTPPTNTWTMITGVGNGTNLITYINGVQTGTPASFSGTLNSTTDIYIGNRSTDDRYWDGYLTDFRFYSSRALTAAEVYQLYVASKIGYKYELNRFYDDDRMLDILAATGWGQLLDNRRNRLIVVQ